MRDSLSPDGARSRHETAGAWSAARVDWRQLCFAQLLVCRFALTAVLLAWGLLALFALALGGFTVDGLMAQLNNLTERYLAAEPARRVQFKVLLAAAQLLLIVLLAVMRGPMLVRDLRREDRP